MSNEGKNFINDIKNKIIAGVGVALTTVGTVFLDELKAIVGLQEKTEEVAEQPAQPQEIIINLPEQKNDTVIKKVILEPKKEKTATQKRKDEGFDL